MYKGGAKSAQSKINTFPVEIKIHITVPKIQIKSLMPDTSKVAALLSKWRE